MTEPQSLPDLPSALITLALDDLEKAEKDPRYAVDMDSWHLPRAGDICSVCLAGSVMAFSLRAKQIEALDPGDFPNEIADKLYALEGFRLGDITRGITCMRPMFGKETINQLVVTVPNCYVVEYCEDPAEFKRQMRDMAAALAKIGL